MSKQYTLHYQDFEELLKMLDQSDHSYDLDLINKAYIIAQNAHGDQRRVSGVPFILHPTSVACILVDLGMDTESIIAAILHDVVEDTSMSQDDITAVFGTEIAHLIDGVTKLGKIPYSTKEEQQAENLRKMLIAMADDIRVVIIKLADRLHNMRTIDCMEEQKRRDKALENMEVFAPIAHRLGMTAVKEELEDLSLRYLDPIGYVEIENTLQEKQIARETFVENIKKIIVDRTVESIPNIFVEGRVKSINGIYRKTYMQGKNLEQIYDIVAVRVIVDTVNDCYNVLGIIHEIFQPLPNRFKDYISMPKNNMYKSLHTTVIEKTGVPFEVQIRTWEMHHSAEYGIAAHWKYKLGISKKDLAFEERIKWIRNMIENQLENDDPTDIVRNIKTDLSVEEVFVFTPKGDVINLPKGSTVIDMAYAIHSEIGNRMIGAKVDKRIVPIDYKVKTGEIIEIITTKESQGPKRDWLKIVRTSEARSKIRQWFKREKREENIAEGKEEFERELKRNGIHLTEHEFFEGYSFVLKKQHCNNMEDFYAAIGYGGLQLWRILPRIKDEYQKRISPPEEITQIIGEEPVRRKMHSGVIVEGMDDVLIKFSKCCNPLPGDDIIGFITRGYGVSIHKRICTNVPKKSELAEEPERWVHAVWEASVHDQFQSTLEIVAANRNGLLADITQQIFTMHVYIQQLHSREIKNDKILISVTLTINDLEHLKVVMSRLSGINGIISIGRL